jgi:hypothetical protein
MAGRVPEACGYYFGTSLKPPVSSDSAGHAPSKSIFNPSLAPVDQDRRMTISYVMNRMEGGMGGERGPQRLTSRTITESPGDWPDKDAFSHPMEIRDKLAR